MPAEPGPDGAEGLAGDSREGGFPEGGVELVGGEHPERSALRLRGRVEGDGRGHGPEGFAPQETGEGGPGLLLARHHEVGQAAPLGDGELLLSLHKGLLHLGVGDPHGLGHRLEQAAGLEQAAELGQDVGLRDPLVPERLHEPGPPALGKALGDEALEGVAHLVLGRLEVAPVHLLLHDHAGGHRLGDVAPEGRRPLPLPGGLLPVEGPPHLDAALELLHGDHPAPDLEGRTRRGTAVAAPDGQGNRAGASHEGGGHGDGRRPAPQPPAAGLGGAWGPFRGLGRPGLRLLAHPVTPAGVGG